MLPQTSSKCKTNTFADLPSSKNARGAIQKGATRSIRNRSTLPVWCNRMSLANIYHTQTWIFLMHLHTLFVVTFCFFSAAYTHHTGSPYISAWNEFSFQPYWILLWFQGEYTKSLLFPICLLYSTS